MKGVIIRTAVRETVIVVNTRAFVIAVVSSYMVVRLVLDNLLDKLFRAL